MARSRGCSDVQPALHLAGTYRRGVRASLARIWENVFDWEHLAHLHSTSFARCSLIARGDWGWRAQLRLAGRGAQDDSVIELVADQPAGRYVTTTLEGQGTGTQICVTLAERGAHDVSVEVEFYVPEADATRLALIGSAYESVYAQLWDEDEAMMQAREAALARSTGPVIPGQRLDLGDEPAVRAALPVIFEMAGRSFRLVAVEGRLVAHSTVCPHWLGPLDAGTLVDGAITCPWHGYRFDIASRRCLDMPGLKLAPAPAVIVENGRVIAVWQQRKSPPPISG